MYYCEKGEQCVHAVFNFLLQGGVILVSHDEHLISLCCNAVWLCKDQLVYRLEGGLPQYKKAIETELRST